MENREQTERVMKTMNEMKNWKTSDIVTSDEGRRRLIMLGSDVIALFPSMKEVSTGRAVSNHTVFEFPFWFRAIRGLAQLHRVFPETAAVKFQLQFQKCPVAQQSTHSFTSE